MGNLVDGSAPHSHSLTSTQPALVRWEKRKGRKKESKKNGGRSKVFNNRRRSRRRKKEKTSDAKASRCPMSLLMDRLVPSQFLRKIWLIPAKPLTFCFYCWAWLHLPWNISLGHLPSCVYSQSVPWGLEYKTEKALILWKHCSLIVKL